MANIYKITSPSNRIYIGSTVNIKRRFQIYKTMKCKEQRRLYASFEKYGVDAHVFEILAECEREEMYKLEAEFGAKFDVLGPNGLNCMLPKNGSIYKVFTDETIKKMSLSRKGRTSAKKGQKATEAQIIKNRIAAIGKKRRSKIVLNIENGIFYDSALDACSTTEINPGSFVNMLNINHRHKNRTPFIYV